MVSFVILHYMAIDVTINCVNDILNRVIGEKEIIIVDNASPNDTGIELKKKYDNIPNVNVILSSENLGFARGNNLGFDFARSNFDNEFIVVMNNDVEIVQDDFIQIIEEIYRKEKFFVLGPNIYAPLLRINQSPKRLTSMSYEEVSSALKRSENSIKYGLITSIRVHLKKIKWLRKYVIDKKINRHDIDYEREYFNIPLHGSFFIFSREFANKRVHCFNDVTFMYYESEILDYECNRDNMKTMYSPRLNVIHYQNIATNLSFKNERKKVDFINKCSVDSLRAFKKIIEKDLGKKV